MIVCLNILPNEWMRLYFHRMAWPGIEFCSFLSPFVRGCLSATQNRLRVWKQFMRFGDKLFHKVNGKSNVHTRIRNCQKDAIYIITCARLCSVHPNQHHHQKRIRQINMHATCVVSRPTAPLVSSVILSTFQVIFQKNTQFYSTANKKRTSSFVVIFLLRCNSDWYHGRFLKECGF